MSEHDQPPTGEARVTVTVSGLPGRDPVRQVSFPVQVVSCPTCAATCRETDLGRGFVRRDVQPWTEYLPPRWMGDYLGRCWVQRRLIRPEWTHRGATRCSTAPPLSIEREAELIETLGKVRYQLERCIACCAGRYDGTAETDGYRVAGQLWFPRALEPIIALGVEAIHPPSIVDAPVPQPPDDKK